MEYVQVAIKASLAASALMLAAGYAGGGEKTSYQQLEWPVTEQEFLAALPDDVYPDSRSRIPLVRREDLAPDRQAGYDARVAADSSSLAGLQGPGGIYLNGSRSLDETRLDKRTLELVRLVVSREMDQPFEWTLHEPVALAAGLEPAIIDVIRHGKPLDGVPEREAVLIQWGREIFREHAVSSETFARLAQHLDTRDLVDLCQFMANYVRTAIVLHTFDAHLPYDREPLLPLP